MRTSKLLSQLVSTLVAGVAPVPSSANSPDSYQAVTPQHVESVKLQRDAALHSWQLAGSPIIDEMTVHTAVDRAAQLEMASHGDAKWDRFLSEFELSAFELFSTIRGCKAEGWTNPLLSAVIGVLIAALVVATGMAVLMANSWKFGPPFFIVVALDLAVLIILLIVPSNTSLQTALETKRQIHRETLENAGNARRELVGAKATRDNLLTAYSLYTSVVALDAQVDWLSKRLLDRRNQLLTVNWRSLRGIPFEEFLTEILVVNGFTCETTRKSGDQGVDIIASKSQRRIAIQAKGYEGSVGNNAVQEVIAGRLFYDCSECVVITNSYFTAAARQLAERGGCHLLDADAIPRFIEFGI